MFISFMHSFYTLSVFSAYSTDSFTVISSSALPVNIVLYRICVCVSSLHKRRRVQPHFPGSQLCSFFFLLIILKHLSNLDAYKDLSPEFQIYVLVVL